MYTYLNGVFQYVLSIQQGTFEYINKQQNTIAMTQGVFYLVGEVFSS